MNIETAKELKALEIGYTDWRTLTDLYVKYLRTYKIQEYEQSALSWVKDGIPKQSIEKINENIMLFGDKYSRQIKDRLKLVAKKPSTNPEILETLNLVNKIVNQKC